MNILHKFALYTSFMLTVACTSESELTVPEIPGGGTSAHIPEREVLLTFDNKLKLPDTKAGESIATEEENRIRSLDIYVFAAETEEDSYSFQQLLYYREDPSQTIAKDWARPFTLMNNNDGKSTSAMLKLKKGLFVKLYCVANQTTLRVPDEAGNGFSVVDINNPGNYFLPIFQTNPGAEDNAVTPGKPTLAEFEQFSTPLLNAAQASDILLTPLAMVDNSTTVLDLHNMQASARLTESFRLTRLAARFDVVNTNKDIKNPDGSIQAKGSNFTITNIYMAKGRPGSSLFPAASCGEVIAYPKRTVKEELQTGRIPGCFYSYASPTEDGAYLVLEGLLRINQTDAPKQVSYQVYFKDPNDPTRSLAIQPNHRYTINITGADEYKLNFNLTAADWNDEDNIDGYEPNNTPGSLTVSIPQSAIGLVTHDVGSKTVTMGLATANTFDVKLKSNSALRVTTSYQDNAENCNWVSVSEPQVNPTVTNDRYTHEYTYTVTPNAGYSGNHFPRATLRFMDLATGDEQILFVKLAGTPVVNGIPKPEWPEEIPEVNKVNEFDSSTQIVSLFLTEDSQIPFTVTCADEVVQEGTLPDYLQLVQHSKQNEKAVYILKLTTTQITDIPAEGVKITFANKNRSELKQSITVKLLDASLVPSFSNLGGTDVQHTPGSESNLDNVTIPFITGNHFTVSILSVDGVDVSIDYNGGSQWLTNSIVPSTRAVGKDHKTDIEFSLVENALPGAKPVTVTLTNKVKGGDYKFTVTPKGGEPVLTKADTPSVPVNDKVEANGNITMYKLPTTSTMTVKVNYLGGSKLSSNNPTLVSVTPAEATSSNESVYTLTALNAGTGTLTLTSAVDETQSTTFEITVLSSAIVIPAEKISLNLEKNATASTASITSPLGFTAADADINWGSEGVSWFTLTTTSVNKDGSIGVKTKDLSSLSPDKVKSATVTLKNKIEGAPGATFIVEPGWMAPTAITSNASALNVRYKQQGTFTVNVPFGGIAAASPENTSYATVVTNISNGEVTYTGIYHSLTGKSQTVNITVTNAMDNTKKITYTVNVQNLRWASGNLVADGPNGAKIGDPTDYGLYFRWGSLLGYDYYPGYGLNENLPAVKPAAYEADPIFTNSPIGDPTHAVNESAGTGDPCKYYLGGKWRMPNRAELDLLFPKQFSYLQDIRGTKIGYDNELFCPAAGYMTNTKGQVIGSSMDSFFWTSTIYDPSLSRPFLFAYNGSSFINGLHYMDSNNGFPIRCVEEP